MPFTIEEFRDLIRILEENPEWRAELRRVLLTDELLQLPSIVRELADAQIRLVEGQRGQAERMDALTEQVSILTEQVRIQGERIDALTEQVSILTQQVRAQGERMDALAEQVRIQGERMDALAEQVRIQGERMDALAEQVSILTQQVRAQGERMDALAEQVSILTQQVMGLIEWQRGQTERMDALTEQVRTQAERMNVLIEQVSLLTRQVRGLLEWQRGEVGRREGERYELQVVKDAPYLFGGGDGGATNDPVVRSRLSQWIQTILQTGRDLVPEEKPTLADLIWWKGEKVLLVEASVKVNGYDVLRAHRRAQILRSIGVDIVPVVVGEEWADLEARELAEEKGVWWSIGGIPSEDLISFRKLRV